MINQETSPRPPEGRPSLIFISHDSRDHELAFEFSKLLRHASGGALKSFRSSDTSGTQGIDFGDEWFSRLMSHLADATDVVCLLTARSIERPWVLYEAGVAKGRLNRRLSGLVLGLPVEVTLKSPFYHFHNCGLDIDSISKLVKQLLCNVPHTDPADEAIRLLASAFVTTATSILQTLDSDKGSIPSPAIEVPSPGAVLEEMKHILNEIRHRFFETQKEGTDYDCRLSVYEAQVARITDLVERVVENETWSNVVHLHIQQLLGLLTEAEDKAIRGSVGESRILRITAVLMRTRTLLAQYQSRGSTGHR